MNAAEFKEYLIAAREVFADSGCAYEVWVMETTSKSINTPTLTHNTVATVKVLAPLAPLPAIDM